LPDASVASTPNSEPPTATLLVPVARLPWPVAVL